MIIEYLKDGKKMLTNKVIYSSNVSSNTLGFSSNSSAVPNTLFELMKTNILVVDTRTDTLKQQDTQPQIQNQF